MATKKRILSGMRPTGPLHLGNFHGALANWVRLQDEFDCFFFIADWHALTTDYETTGNLSDFSRMMAIDWLSVGLSPEKATLFVQSQVKEHAELILFLSMLTPLGWLERNPTYKDQMAQLTGKDISTFGFLGYPVLQAADIIMYKADLVPVGEDQVPHVEITREIARRFNHFYGPVFPEPQAGVVRERALVQQLPTDHPGNDIDALVTVTAGAATGAHVGISQVHQCAESIAGAVTAVVTEAALIHHIVTFAHASEATDVDVCFVKDMHAESG